MVVKGRIVARNLKQVRDKEVSPGGYMKLRKRLEITKSILSGISTQVVAEEYGISSERVRQITHEVAKRLNEDLYNDCDDLNDMIENGLGFLRRPYICECCEEEVAFWSGQKRARGNPPHVDID